MLELLKEQGLLPAAPVPDCYAVVPQVAAMPQVMAGAARPARGRGSVQMHAGGSEGHGSMKSQFKKADASGARYALIFGESELAAGQVGGQAAARGRWRHHRADPVRARAGQAMGGAAAPGLSAAAVRLHRPTMPVEGPPGGPSHTTPFD